MKFLTNGIICLLALCFCIQVQAQSWTERTSADGKPANFYEIQSSFNAEWGDKKIVRGQGIKPFKRWEYHWETRVNDDGSFPDAGTVNREWKKYLRSHESGAESMVANWQSLGPNSNSSGYAGTGRIGCVAFHPTNTSLYYIGSAAGGIWKTTNDGSSWTPLLDDQASIGVSSIVVDQNTPNTIYIATGDGDGKDTYSIGVLKSTDGGTTWNTTGLNWNTSAADVIYRMIMDPNDANTLMVASNNGIYRTTDAGANWTLEKSGNYYDIIAKPDAAATTFYATRYSSSTVYVDRSTDNGANWTQTYSTSGRRGAFGVTAANSAYVYLLVANTSNGFGGMYRSTDSGVTFSQQSNSPNILTHSATGTGTGGQGWYDLCAAGDPLNANTIYIGGVNCWKSTDGGVNWTLKSHWSSTNGGSNQVVHADKHALFWQNNTTLFEGNDGGVYKTTNGGTTWTDVTSNLVISQMYKIGVSQTDSKVLIGLQDNGTKLRSTGGSWSDEIGGDGMECAISPTNSNIMFGELYYGQVRRNTNGGSGSWSTITGSLPDGAWVTPFALDPVTPTTMYIGLQDVYKSTNQGTTWTSIASTTSSDLRHLVIAPSNTNYIYIGTTSSFWRTTDGGTTWNSITAPNSSITYLAVSPTDPNTIYATRGSFSNGNKVYKSTNGGSSWTNISGTLPNIPANTIVYQENTGEGLYVGMDVGIYYRDNTMSDWVLYNTNLPNAPVSELEINYSTNKIVAGTYGRGLWESDLFAVNSDYINLTPSTLSVAGTAGSEVVAVSANVSWTATSNDAWITVSPTSGTNDGNITLTIAANPNCSTRTGSVTVSDGTISTNVTVDQAIGGTALTAPFSESFDITSIPGCWTMSGVEDWKFTTDWPAYGAAGVAENTGNGGSFAGVDGSNTNGSDTQLESALIDISALTNPFLSFYVFSNNTNSPGDNADLHVEIYDGSTWTNELTYAADNANWVQQFVDLSAYSGNIRVRFTIDHTVMTNNQYHNDVMIDDVSVANAAGCTGTPNGGTATGPTSDPCAGADFDITITGQSTGANISQQWESSTDGVTWTPVVGQTGSTLTTSVTVPTYFRLNVNCSSSGLSGYSNSVLITPFADACLCACTSNATSTIDTKIDTISFNGTAFGTDPSTCETFTDHPSPGLTFAPGETINMVVRNGSCSGTHYSAYLGVFADWNGDGDFDDTGEDVHGSLETTALNTLAPFSFTVPAGQSDGSVKIRFILNESATPPSACGTFTYGETEDFCVDIQTPSSCTPDLLTGVSALVLDSTKASIIWDATPEAGFFKIQYRELGASSWTLINVKNQDYQRVAWIISGLAKNTTYQYRARKQCPDLAVGPYTPIQEFTTFTTSPCEIPDNSQIVYMSIPTKVRIFIDYEPTGEKYDVRWRVDGTTGPIDNKVFKKSTSVLAGLTPATTYEYRMRTKCNGVWTGYSSWIDFTTNANPPVAPPVAARGDKLSTNSGQLALYPNPVNQTLYVEFEGLGSKHIRMMDMSGRVVLDQITQENLQILDVAKYPQGTYFMQVIFENGNVVTQKLIKQ